MAYKKGRQSYLAIKKEATRGTAETTGFEFVPWSRLNGMIAPGHRDKVGSVGTRSGLIGQDLVTQHGDFSYGDDIDADYMHFPMEAIFGESSSSVADGCETVDYTVSSSIEGATYTAQYDKNNTEKRQYGICAKSLKIKTTKEASEFDLEGFGIKEENGASLTPSVALPTRPLLGRHLTVSYADTKAGLSSATALTEVTELEFELDTGADPKKQQVMNGSLAPKTITFNGITGSLTFTVLVNGSEAATVKGWGDNGDNKAFKLAWVANNQANIGSSSNKPSLFIEVPPSQVKVEDPIELDELFMIKVNVDIAQAALVTGQLLRAA